MAEQTVDIALSELDLKTTTKTASINRQKSSQTQTKSSSNYKEEEIKSALLEETRKVIELNSNYYSSEIQDIKTDIQMLKSKRSSADLELDSLCHEVAFNFNKFLSSTGSKSLMYLANSRSYAKAYINKSTNLFSPQTQAVSVILDAIIYNEPELLIKSKDILENVLNEIKNKTITDSRVEIYTENLYKDGLRLFKNQNEEADILNLIPENLRNLFEE